MTTEIERLVTSFYFSYAAALDRRDPAAWIACFVDDGVYTLTTHRNATTHGMYLTYESGRDAIARRAAVTGGYLKAQRNKTLHMISNVRVGQDDHGRLTAAAYFAAFRTARNGTSQLYACGEFADLLDLSDGRVRFIEHNVVVDAETLPANMIDLL